MCSCNKSWPILHVPKHASSNKLGFHRTLLDKVKGSIYIIYIFNICIGNCLPINFVAQGNISLT